NRADNFLKQWNRIDGPPSVAFILRREIAHDPVKVRSRLLSGYTRLQSANSFHIVRSAVGRISLKLEWSPGIHGVAISQGVVAISRMIDSSRHHAHHRIGSRIQQYLAAQNIRRRKLVPPDTITQDHY